MERGYAHAISDLGCGHRLDRLTSFCSFPGLSEVVMTLRQLRIFVSVARHLNITRASQELHMSQPAVSQQLKLLEQQCETKFVVRTSQGVELTERGRAFLDAIRPIVARVKDVESTFKIKRMRE